MGTSSTAPPPSQQHCPTPTPFPPHPFPAALPHPPPTPAPTIPQHGSRSNIYHVLQAKCGRMQFPFEASCRLSFRYRYLPSPWESLGRSKEEPAQVVTHAYTLEFVVDDELLQTMTSKGASWTAEDSSGAPERQTLHQIGFKRHFNSNTVNWQTDSYLK